MRPPRRSRRVRGEHPVEAFVDADMNQEGEPPKDVPMHSMLHAATDADENEIFEMCQPEFVNFKLRKAVDALHEENNPKDLESCTIGYILNQM